MAGLQGAGAVAATGLAGFLALQGADVTLGLAWACLVVAAALALWRDRIDLSHAPDALEGSLLAFLAVAVAASLAGLDPRRSFALSVPVLAAVPLWFLLVRGDGWPALARWLTPALGLAGVIQVALVAVVAWRQPGGEPAAWVRDSGAAWLVVPNDLAWTACLPPFVRATGPRWLWPLLAAALLTLALWLHSLTLLGASLAALIAQELLRRGVRLLQHHVPQWRQPPRTPAGAAGLGLCAGAAAGALELRGQPPARRMRGSPSHQHGICAYA